MPLKGQGGWALGGLSSLHLPVCEAGCESFVSVHCLKAVFFPRRARKPRFLSSSTCR